MNEEQIDNKLEVLNKIVGHNAWLKSTTPLNRKDEKSKVLSSPTYNPNFELPKLQFDPKTVFADLDFIENEAPGTIYGNLQKEEANALGLYLQSMLARDSADFQHSIEMICQRPDEDDKEWAGEWYGREVEEEPAVVTPGEFKSEFESYLKACEIERPYDIEISDERSGIIVLQEDGKIIIPNRNRSLNELRGLKVHEIGTHIVQYENGSLQPRRMFKYGFPSMPFTVEGLALVNEQRVGAETDIKRKKRAGNIKAMLMAADCPFADIYNELLKVGFSEDAAFGIAYLSKRGFSDTSRNGANFGPNIYRKGLRKVKAYLDSGGDENILYAGRVSLESLEDIKKIGVKPPKYKPRLDLV